MSDALTETNARAYAESIIEGGRAISCTRANADDIEVIDVVVEHSEGLRDIVTVWLEPRGDGTSFIYGEW
jgi:hypothetical protein